MSLATSGRLAGIQQQLRSREVAARRQLTRGLKTLGLRPAGERPDYVEFWPPVRDAKEFSDLSTRVNCYLGDIDLPLYLPGPRFDLDPQLIPYMEPELVKDPGWVSERPPGRGYLVIHRLAPTAVAKLLSHGGAGVAVVDKDLYQLSEMTYWPVRDRLAWPSYPAAESSLARLRERFPSSRTSFILATGPSALTVDLKSLEADVRITCNSAVRDRQRLEDFKPGLIAFTDPVFHFGPSRYAAQFRKDLLAAVDQCDPLLLCGAEWVGPLMNLLPQLKSRLVVIPRRAGGDWRWPTDRDPTTRPTQSVLTNLLLPVAFMLSDHVSVAGVDGRQPTETYFWKHGLQYSDELMKSVFDAHPAFFRDRDFGDHYDRYCGEIEALVLAGEAAGKTVEGAAPSWIPAFRKRGAPEPESA
jgi:hypothetical protein